MELPIIASLIIIVLLLSVIFRLKTKQNDVRGINRDIERKEADLQRSIRELTDRQHSFSQTLMNMQQQKQQLDKDIADSIVKQKQEAVTRVSEYESSEKRKIEYLLDKLATQSEADIKLILEDYEGYQEYIRNKEKGLVEGLEDAAAKYAATMSVFRQLDLEVQELSAYMIQLSENDREDIAFLISEVVPKMHSPQLLNKLIWTEYVMKPTGELLKRILPNKDCSGIYKITHVPDKKAYVGRSTSVYKRLQEHIKSSLGVGTIADQWVHHQMREKGIENFTFELVEECDKDKLADREKYYIKFFDTERWGYNKNTGG